MLFNHATVQAQCGDGQALEQVAQGNSGITIPGSVQKLCSCGIEGHGLMVEVAVLD